VWVAILPDMAADSCHVLRMSIQTPAPPSLVGHVRRFGPYGVLYEIVRILDDKRALIRVIDTGEETPYSLNEILTDPTD
jgi:Family of unknown function (DUF5397)